MNSTEESATTNLGPTRNISPLYRAFEIVPGALAWTTLFGMVFFSWWEPLAASFFIIIFDLYWLLKTLFFTFHIAASYRTMRHNLTIDWMGRVRTASVDATSPVHQWSDIVHLIILPAYKEPYEIIRTSLLAISASSWPTSKMIVVLGIEERGGEEDKKSAETLKEEFEKKFYRFIITIHPSTIPGEIPGKGSNAAYAARGAQKIIDELAIPYSHVLCSSLDSDTQVYPQYFALVAYKYLTEPDSIHASFQPIPVYHNNIWDAPAISRVVSTSDTFWQMIQQARPERLDTFSSHSMPFSGLVEVGFWHTNIVSEDSRIFWQLFLHYSGGWRVIPLYYPVSMDTNIAPTLWKTALNVYRQHRRWVWGVENIPYILYGFVKNKKIPLKKKIFYTWDKVEGFWSLSTNALLILFLGWLPPFLGGNAFSTTVLAHNLPQITQILMTLAMFGLAFNALVSLSLLPTRPKKKPYHWKWWLLLEWLLIVITGTLFGAIPGLETQTRLMFGNYLGFWRTPKMGKQPETSNIQHAT